MEKVLDHKQDVQYHDGHNVQDKVNKENNKNNLSYNNASTNTNHKVISQGVSSDDATFVRNEDTSRNSMSVPHPRSAAGSKTLPLQPVTSTLSQQHRQAGLRKIPLPRPRSYDRQFKDLQKHVKLLNASMKASYNSPYSQQNFISHKHASKTSSQNDKSTPIMDPANIPFSKQSENSENSININTDDLPLNDKQTNVALSKSITSLELTSIKQACSLPPSLSTSAKAPALLFRDSFDLSPNATGFPSPTTKPQSYLHPVKHYESQAKRSPRFFPNSPKTGKKQHSPKPKRVSKSYALLKRKPTEEKSKGGRHVTSSPNNPRSHHAQTKQRSPEGHRMVSPDRTVGSKPPPSGRSRQTRTSARRRELATQQRHAAKPSKHQTNISPDGNQVSCSAVQKYTRPENPNSPHRRHDSVTAALQFKTAGRKLLYKRPTYFSSKQTPDSTNSQPRSKSRSGNSERRSKSQGDSKGTRCQKGCHNVRKTALLLKFQTERWRVNASSSGTVGCAGPNAYLENNQDCFAAWELTQHEVMQSCKSEDLLIMKNNLQQSTPHSSKKTAIPYKCKYIMITRSDDSLEDSKNWVQRHETRYNIVTCGNVQQGTDSHGDPHLPQRNSKTHSVYTTTDETSSGEWDQSSSLTSTTSPKKNNKSGRCLSHSKQRGYLNNVATIKQQASKKLGKDRRNNTNKQSEIERRNHYNNKRHQPKESHSIRNNLQETASGLVLRRFKTSIGFPERANLPAEKNNRNLHPQKQIENSSKPYSRMPSTDQLKHKRLPITRPHFSNDVLRKSSITLTNSTSEVNSSLVEAVYQINHVESPPLDASKKCKIFQDDGHNGTVSKYSSKCATSKSKLSSTRTETNKKAFDARRCSISFQPSKKTPMCVWKWRLLGFAFMGLLAICHYLAFLATSATV